LTGADWTGEVSIGLEVIGPGVIGEVLIGADATAPPPGTITTTPVSPCGIAWVWDCTGRLTVV
jgi:hypothetical protein